MGAPSCDFPPRCDQGKSSKISSSQYFNVTTSEYNEQSIHSRSILLSLARSSTFDGLSRFGIEMSAVTERGEGQMVCTILELQSASGPNKQ